MTRCINSDHVFYNVYSFFMGIIESLGVDHTCLDLITMTDRMIFMSFVVGFGSIILTALILTCVARSGPIAWLMLVLPASIITTFFLVS